MVSIRCYRDILCIYIYAYGNQHWLNYAKVLFKKKNRVTSSRSSAHSMGLKKSVNPIPLSPPRDRGFFVGDSHIFFGRSEAEAQVEYQIRVDNCENCVSE